MSVLPGKPASNSVQSGHDQLSAISPGERLQKARKERELEIAAVAERLNLSPGVVRALEADDYRMLPNATFVKGYLRSYARALEINGDDLVRSYEAITGCNQPVAIEPIGVPMVSDPRKTRRNLLLALVGGLVVATGLWWGMAGETPAPKQAQVSNDQSPVAAAVQSNSTQLAPPVVITRPSSDQQALAEAEAVNEPVDEVVAEPSAATDALPPEAEPVEQPVAAPVPVVEAPVAVTPATPAPVNVQPQETSPPLATGSGLITLRFQGECWVEVKDGNGAMVFSSLKRGGEEVSLRAATPINVKLGNGDVVEVLYNHEIVPFSTRPDRKVVRLTLGE